MSTNHPRKPTEEPPAESTEKNISLPPVYSVENVGSEANPDTESADHGHHAAADRSANRIALTAVAALVLYSTLGNDEQPTVKKTVQTAPVTYQVEGTGTADISYRALNTTTGTADHASTATAVHLPWKKTVAVPLGEDPIISITLGHSGGQARCQLAIRGRHVQSATATGQYGRATCSAPLPRP